MNPAPSPAAQIIVSVIPIVAIVMGSALLFFYFFWNHKQRMLMIEKGLLDKTIFDLDSFSLFSGLLMFIIGISLTLFFYLKEGISYSMLSGLIPLASGFSLIVFFIIRRLYLHQK